MKRLKLVSLAMIGAIATSVALAATPLKLGDELAQLNQAIVSLLTPFQNDTTKGELSFSKLRTGRHHTLKVALKGLYAKLGTRTSLTITADEVSYRYGSGRHPTTTIRGSAAIDLTKIMGIADLNELLANIESIIPQYAQDLTSDFGDAVTVSAKVTDKVFDQDGNYVSLKGSLNMKFDLSKLPADKKLEDVMIKAINAEISLNVETGVVLNMSIVSNPKYKGFNADEQGLKELLDKLLKQDPEQLKMIEDTFRQMDDIVGGILN